MKSGWRSMSVLFSRTHPRPSRKAFFRIFKTWIAEPNIWYLQTNDHWKNLRPLLRHRVLGISSRHCPIKSSFVTNTKQSDFSALENVSNSISTVWSSTWFQKDPDVFDKKRTMVSLTVGNKNSINHLILEF